MTFTPGFGRVWHGRGVVRRLARVWAAFALQLAGTRIGRVTVPSSGSLPACATWRSCGA